MKKHQGVDIPSTAREWELFSGMDRTEEASKAMTEALEKALSEADARLKETVQEVLSDVYRKYIDPKQDEYLSEGAGDSEPRNHALDALYRWAKSKGHTKELRGDWSYNF